MTTVSIRVDAHGADAARPPLVLGPSLGTVSAQVWEDAEARLAARFTLVHWDLPGHGTAPASDSPFTVADLADALAAALPGPVAYAGVSLGGAVGLELARRHPHLVASLAVVCSAAAFGEPQAWEDRAAQVRSTGTAALVTGAASRWFAPETIGRRPDLVGRLLHGLRDADDASYARCCEALARFDAREHLGEVEAPTLALWGDLDPVTPEACAAEVAHGVRRGRAQGIAGASHLAPVDAPQAVADALITHLEGHP
ncbi:alpha/beta fold hydrolase [Demequina sp. NBRC 110056]|uniref:alpha/beta fold hydrolase n=1 Tax=Demequina sp. NBRC 110056 TaxID=1570345 RepID=UPI000A03134C|nr:alpha/beta fold hydrolase [Demequina sp. NBRC 110056]